MKKNMVISAIALILISFAIQGCGYRVGSILPMDIHTIAIPTFINKTMQPGIETSITNTIIDRFQIDGTLRVVEQKNADVKLLGKLIEYKREPLRYTGADYGTVTEYRLKIVCEITLIDLTDNEPLWKNRIVVGETTFKTGGDLNERELSAIGTTLTSEKAQLPTLEEDLAYKVVESVVEGW